jgi:hypothetical protein
MFGFVTPICTYIELNMNEHNAMSCNVATPHQLATLAKM